MIDIFIKPKVKSGEISSADYDEIQKYKIRELCNCIDSMNANREEREKYLTERLKGADSNEKGYHDYLIKYPWKKIYTVNIDDLVENIYEKNHKGYLSYTLNEHIPDKCTEKLILIKLHGDVRKPDKKYIFSQDEYNELITKKIDIGMNAFVMEFYSTNDIIFIGASLDEPDFEYYLQIYEDLHLKSRKNKLFFIEPYPTLALKQKAAKLNAVIITWTTEKFLQFVQKLNYRPKGLETIKGAGFSREAICDSGIMPTGNELCSEMIDIFIKPKVKSGEISSADYDEIQKYKIRELCNCIDSMNANREEREKYLTERLKGADSNEKGYHDYLIKYPWKKIYTVNIDDLVENIYEKNHKGYLSYTLNEHIPDKCTEKLILIKLHGDVRKPDKKYIFSQDEYNELITKKIDIGMNAFVMEFYSTNDIIFIGASLDEPDFEYYLQIYEDLHLKSRKNKLFFIEPYPTLALKQKAAKLNAVIITWTTEKFLQFVQKLNYRPKGLETINENRLQNL